MTKEEILAKWHNGQLIFQELIDQMYEAGYDEGFVAGFEDAIRANYD